MEKINSLRIIFKEMIEDKLVAETTNKQPITVICNESQLQELAELSPVLRPGNVFNLLNASKLSPDNAVTAEFLVFEPDYLIDISALAECFRPYGNHFLNYTLSRLQEKETTPAILLGNTANFFIDELVNEDAENPANYDSAIKKCSKRQLLSLPLAII